MIKQKTKEIDYKLEFAKDNLKREKEIYQNHIDAIVKYSDDLAVKTIRAEDMKNNAMKNLLEYCEKNSKSFVKVCFSDMREKNSKPYDELTEVEKIEGETNHYKVLNKWAKFITNGFEIPVKEKMAKDLIDNFIAWNTFFDDLSKLYNQEKAKPEVKNDKIRI